jgi:hypothetical protein
MVMMQRCGVALWAVCLMAVWLPAAVLDLPVRRTDGWITFRGDGATNQVHTLERSANLTDWSTAAVLHHADWAFTDTGVGELREQGFLRLRSRAIGSADDGRNHLRLPLDPFTNADPDPFSFTPAIRWVKFAIVLSEPDRVWFQDSRRRMFHHDWAQLRLPVFRGTTRAQFDSMTLNASNRVAILGAVLVPPGTLTPEYGIQLVGRDAFGREELVSVLRRVMAAVQAPPGWQAFYVPTAEQSTMVAREREWLEGQGVAVTGAERWQQGDAVYSPGWAVGRLVSLPSTGIAAAYASGALRPSDILLTDVVPAEVPFVAGIVTLTPATPNSHVAILARTYGVPFGWPSDAGLRAMLPGWSGRDVAVRVEDWRGRVEVVDLTGELDASLRDAIAARKSVKPLQITPKARLGAYWTNTTNLKPADVKWVGGKAANFGVLRRVLPTNSPVAIALTFDLWDDFMDQPVAGGRTLREEIGQRVGAVTYPPADVAAVTIQLAAVRDLIRRTARFSPAQQAAIVALLQGSGVPVDRKIRFRSSTNVEDTEQFTGAGLYDSYSGCLTDDLDGDTAGPSECDPLEREERGVFRAIQRVYASFYNDNAFLERRRLGVDESKVGMAVLVHESFPDSDELANGVTTLNWNAGFGGSPSSDWRMVTQVGAESVTNPESTARPEVVEGYRFGTSYSLALREGSSRVPLGATILKWESEYDTFGRLFNRVADAYAPLSGGKTSFALDFEFKKSQARGWQVKQVRPLPKAATGGSVTPILLNAPVDLCVAQAEFGNVFAMHRMKARWSVSLQSTLLTSGRLQNTLLRSAEVVEDRPMDPARWTNGPSGWPGVGFRRTGDGTHDWFEIGSGATRRRWTLEMVVPTSMAGNQSPVLFTEELTFRAIADYGTPQPMVDWNGDGTTTEDMVHLVPCPEVTPESLLQERRMGLGLGATVVARFYWPDPPRGVVAGYTAPCIGWVGTTITGLTTEPLELRADAAQTYHPFHHNFSEEYLFEPAADPSVNAVQRAELAARNIRMIHIDWDHQSAVVRVVGLDGRLRRGL